MYTLRWNESIACVTSCLAASGENVLTCRFGASVFRVRVGLVPSIVRSSCLARYACSMAVSMVDSIKNMVSKSHVGSTIIYRETIEDWGLSNFGTDTHTNRLYRHPFSSSVQQILYSRQIKHFSNIHSSQHTEHCPSTRLSINYNVIWVLILMFCSSSERMHTPNPKVEIRYRYAASQQLCISLRVEIFIQLLRSSSCTDIQW